MKKIITIFLFVSIFCFVDSVLAVSIGVKPKNLDAKLKIGKIEKIDILISNTGEEPAVYNAYPYNYKKNISVTPSDFWLEPNSNRIVEVKMRAWIPKKRQTFLSIVARPNNVQNMPAIPGIKIPLTMNFSLFSSIFMYSILLIFIFCIFGLFVVILKRNK